MQGRIALSHRLAVPERFQAAYLALGYPNPEKTVSKGWMLPIPATYVLDSTGLVVLSYLDADYCDGPGCLDSFRGGIR